MDKKFKCSLFCSFFKGQKFVKEYLVNCTEQSIFEDIEFVFLDCGSPENERDIIQTYTKAFHNIKYYRLDKDPGLYAGWNIAIKKCSSEIIGNWNIDDRKNSEGIEIMLKQFSKHPDIDMVYGLTYISNKANEKYIDNDFSKIYPCLPHSFNNLIRNNSPHCMPLWKKNLHDRYGFFDENYKTASDGDFWLRCAAGGATIGMVNHPVGLYYENPEGRSTNPETLKQMVEEVTQMRSKYQKYIGVIE